MTALEERPLLSDLPSHDIDIDELGSRIIGMAGRLAAATCRWLLLVAAFDARRGFDKFLLPSTAHWLSHYCGLSRRTARDHVRVARVLAAHSVLAGAMNAGRISYSHVRAISRAADLGGEQLVADLVMVAEHGTVGQLEDMVRGLRTVDDNNRDGREPRPERLSHRWRADSRFGLSAALDPENGALVLMAIQAVARREQITQAQALTRIAEISLATLNAAGNDPVPRLRGDEHAAVVIQLAATQQDGSAEPRSGAEPARSGAEAELERLSGVVEQLAGPPARDRGKGRSRGKARDQGKARNRGKARFGRPICRIARGPGLPVEVIERLACAGRVRLITFDPRIPPGETPSPLDVGHSRRLVSDKQFRALLARDGGCAHPGCGSRIGLEAHHVRHWLDGGKTVLANLVLLCRRHHHAHHDADFTVVALGGGRFRFLRADGGELPRHVDPSTHIADQSNIEDDQHGVAVDAATGRWDGSRLDHDFAVAVLSQRLDSTQLAKQRAAAKQQSWAGHDPWSVQPPSAATAA
jgi:hypothetical protein